MRKKVAKRIRELSRLTSGPTKAVLVGGTIYNSGFKKVLKETKKTLKNNKSKPLEKTEKNKEK